MSYDFDLVEGHAGVVRVGNVILLFFLLLLQTTCDDDVTWSCESPLVGVCGLPMIRGQRSLRGSFHRLLLRNTSLGKLL